MEGFQAGGSACQTGKKTTVNAEFRNQVRWKRRKMRKNNSAMLESTIKQK